MQANLLLLLLILTIGLLGAVLLLAMVRLADASRQARRRLLTEDDAARVTAALSETVNRIQAKERETQARAEAFERLSEQIIASLSSGLLVVDGGGEVRILNPVGRRLLGVEPDVPLGIFRDLVGPPCQPLADLIDEGLAGGTPIVRRTVEIRSGDLGATTHLGVSVSPLRDEHGGVAGVICLFADLSAVFALEERVRLKESLAQVGELTAGIAHEFRNGLATIHGYGRLIVPDRMPEEYRPYLEGIRDETAALREVVDRFLAFARPAELTVAEVSLRRVVDRAAGEIQGDVERRGGQVSVAGEFALVDGDEVLLRQAFSNLCRNALDACVDADRVPQIRLEGTVQDGQACLVVTDNGPGFDPGQRERLFQPFFTTKGHGTGLGLALTQKIIVTHNGSIGASLSDEGGARIEVLLPIHRASHGP